MKNVFAKEDMGARETIGWCRFTSLKGLDYVGIGHSKVELRIWYPVHFVIKMCELCDAESECKSSSECKCSASTSVGAIAFGFVANGQTWSGQNYTHSGQKVCEIELVEYFEGLPPTLEEYISKGLFYGKTTNKIAVKS